MTIFKFSLTKFVAEAFVRVRDNQDRARQSAEPAMVNRDLAQAFYMEARKLGNILPNRKNHIIGQILMSCEG